MKICTKCGATYNEDLDYCVKDEMVLIEIEISPKITAEFIVKSFHDQISAVIEPVQIITDQNLSDDTRNRDSKLFPAMKLWSFFVMIFIGSMTLAVLGFGNFNRGANISETNINIENSLQSGNKVNNKEIPDTNSPAPQMAHKRN